MNRPILWSTRAACSEANPLWIAATFVVCIWVAGTEPARAGVLDSFEATSLSGMSLTTPMVVNHVDEDMPGVMGGNRMITVEAEIADSLTHSVGFEIFDGTASFASGPASIGSLLLVYAGPTLIEDLGGTLDEISLAFATFDAAFDAPLTVTISLFDGIEAATHTAQLTEPTMTPHSMAFDVASFDNIGALDLSHLVAIGVLIDPPEAQDFELTRIDFRLVPEPSTWMLLALGGLLACASQRWRR